MKQFLQKMSESAAHRKQSAARLIAIQAGPGTPATRALFGAIRVDDASGVQDALAQGALINGIYNGDSWGSFTPLIMAIAMGNAEIVKLLLDAGADVDGKPGKGTTPIMRATLEKASRDAPVQGKDYDQIIQLLKAAGAQVDLNAEKAMLDSLQKLRGKRRSG